MIFKDCGKKAAQLVFCKELRKIIGRLQKQKSNRNSRSSKRRRNTPSPRGLTAPKLVSVQDDF